MSGIKGTNIKVLDQGALEKAVFHSNRFILDANEEVNNILAEIRKIENGGVSNLEGGQGDDIMEAVEHTKKAVDTLQKSLKKISDSLNTKLAKVLEAYKDKNGLKDSADKAKQAAMNAGLKKQ